MKLSDFRTGTSLVFDEPLPRGPDHIVTGEHDCSWNVTCRIIPTPDDDWNDLRRVLTLDVRRQDLQAREFQVAYVPYTDGRIHYHEGVGAVLSGQFSGCLMAVYEDDFQRRVAHVPKSHIVRNDCIGEFRDYFAEHSTRPEGDKDRHAKARHRLRHFFQPFVDDRDGDVQAVMIGKLIQARLIADPYAFNVFGLVTAPEDDCVSLWLVKTARQPRDGELWHVLYAAKRPPVRDFRALAGKVNRTTLAVMPE